jgi:hypothetical protein
MRKIDYFATFAPALRPSESLSSGRCVENKR